MSNLDLDSSMAEAPQHGAKMEKLIPVINKLQVSSSLFFFGVVPHAGLACCRTHCIELTRRCVGCFQLHREPIANRPAPDCRCATEPNHCPAQWPVAPRRQGDCGVANSCWGLISSAPLAVVGAQSSGKSSVLEVRTLAVASWSTPSENGLALTARWVLCRTLWGETSCPVAAIS